MQILFFTFANAPDRRLDSLQQEDDDIYRQLLPLASQSRFLICRDSFVTRENLAHYLTLYREQLSVFHYSGHADARLLETERGASRVEGIVTLLKRCPNLKLVVLNGCCTEHQAKALLDAGVPVVIATHSAVRDDAAALFGAGFYQALAAGDNIAEAFEAALGSAQLEEGAIKVQRSIGIPAGQDSDAPVWGRFSRSKLDLEWRLPDTPDLSVNRHEPNRELIQALLEAFAPYDTAIAQMLEREKRGQNVSLLDKRAAVLRCPPHPISESLRKLLVPSDTTALKFYDKPGPDRLRQICIAYAISIELFGFTMLAQLCEQLLHSEGRQTMQLPDELTAPVRSFFSLPLSERPAFSFIPLIRALRQLLDRNNIPYFIEELGDIRSQLTPGTPFFEACEFLEMLNARLFYFGEMPVRPEADSLCVSAEKHLANFFRQLGFTARYTLTSVKKIHVFKNKYLQRNPRFRHQLVRLVLNIAGLAEEDELLDRILDNDSVLILRSGESSEFLNLSPFVIDENAFDDNAPMAKLHFFDRYEKAADTFAYRHVYKPDDKPLLVRDQKHFLMLKEQFDAFSKTLFQQPMRAL